MTSTVDAMTAPENTKTATENLRASSEDSMPSTEDQYQKHRGEIEDGDILLYRGTDFTSKYIRLMTGSNYSHAAVAAKWNERLMILEAVGNGVVTMRLSANLKHHDGQVECWRSIKSLSEDDRKIMISFAKDQLGKEYNFFQVAMFGLKLLFNIKASPKSKKIKGADTQYFCSEYVTAIYAKAGITLGIKLGPRDVSPEVLCESEALKQIFVIRKG